MIGTGLLGGIALLLVGAGAAEVVTHRRNLRKIPIRVHVNGTRGKSSVTRLIAAALREGGTVTCAKTTGTLARFIQPDGRELPKDPNPTWFGYSVGRWDGDVFVVETAGFNETGWLDNAGKPATEHLRVTERFIRKDFGHMDIQITIDDPKAYTKPWTVTQPLAFQPDTELLEYICNENNKYFELVPKEGSRLKALP